MKELWCHYPGYLERFLCIVGQTNRAQLAWIRAMVWAGSCHPHL